jgi:glycerophosphoryl diester phosphodiesterase
VLGKIAVGAAVFVAVVWAWNTSLLATVPDVGDVKLLSHRGVHQTFGSQDLESDTCTAERIFPPTHDYIENTLPSMRAAFEHGASVVELDIHLTPDGRFAVFHDWTLDCRTDGEGITEETEMTRLKALDIGYGYTADGGKTYPFRGRGIGLMPTLGEVLSEFPGRRFLINFKSQRQDEAVALAGMLNENPAWREAIFGVYGGSVPTRESLRLVPGLRGYDKKSSVSCLGQYLAYGWTGIVPGACKDALVIVPANYAWMMWGWPYRFADRMRDAGSEIILLGPYEGGGFTSGIDLAGQVDLVPENFDGYVWTNRIETIGPLLNGD